MHPECANCVRHAIACDFSLPPAERAALERRLLHDQHQQKRQRAVASSASSSSPASTPVAATAAPIITATAAPTPTAVAATSTATATATATATTAIPPTATDLHLLLDLSLMHHWATATADALSSHPRLQELWRSSVPALAVHHPFLMHAVLAIAALHFCAPALSAPPPHSPPPLPRHSPSPRRSPPPPSPRHAPPQKRAHYQAVAAHHHERAVHGMAASLSRISPANCDALVVASCLVVVYALVSLRIDREVLEAGTGPVAGSRAAGSRAAGSGAAGSGAAASGAPATVASWLPLLRGVHCMLKQAWAWGCTGPLAPLIAPYDLAPPSPCVGAPVPAPPSADDGALDAESDAALAALYRLCTDRSLPSSDELNDTSTSTAYFSAIAELRRALASADTAAAAAAADPSQCQAMWPAEKRQCAIGSIFVWPVAASDRFVHLLVHEHRPRALIIFLHYCALFLCPPAAASTGTWWCDGVARIELRCCLLAAGGLADAWMPFVAWPRRRILGGGGGGGGGGSIGVGGDIAR